MLRIAAVFVLLALRPSMIVLGAALLNDFSDGHTSIQYINDDLEAHQLHPSRQTWSHASPAKIHFPAGVLPLSGRYFSTPTQMGSISARYEGSVPNARFLRAASRSPPL